MPNEKNENEVKKIAENKAFSKEKLEEYLKDLPDWKIIHEDSVDKLTRQFTFNDFSEVLDFTQSMDNLTREENHPPVLKSSWAKVDVYWWTQAQAGIQEQDFQMAARCDQIYSKLMKSKS
mgnify:CR=1 FL=1